MQKAVRFLGSDRAPFLAAMIVTGIVGVLLLTTSFGGGWTAGDPDDALRLSIVRDLAHGRGWFDQRVDRLQPPLGTYMHWSRLLDGGLALTDRLFGEHGMRALWPLLWIFPAAWSVVTIARSVAREEAKGLAVLFAVALLLIVQPIYGQFRPGRIDHHNVQIALCLVALACAVARGGRVRGALGAGLATGLGLAIGLEALPFEAAIGAGIALEFVVDPRSAHRARAYGLGLASAATGCFLIQTPPSRWGLSVCDALGVNLVLGLVAAGAGLSASAILTRKRSWRVRLVAVGAAGVIAAALYLSLKSACIHSVFAEVDPRLGPFWFDHVDELRPIGRVLIDAPIDATHIIIAALIAVVSLGGVIALRPRGCWPDPPFVNLTVCTVLAVAAGFAAERMCHYIMWFAIPSLATLFADAFVLCGPSARRTVGRFAIAGAALPLLVVTLKAYGAVHTAAPIRDLCADPQAFAVLARQPPGVVLGEIDLGSYVLANTASSALAAPYHRMAWGNLAAHAALSAPVDRAEGRVRALNASYVLECPAHRHQWSRLGMSADALQRRLDAGQPPAWLHPLTAPGATLEIYRVSR
jgi:hypothetical protein